MYKEEVRNSKSVKEQKKLIHFPSFYDRKNESRSIHQFNQKQKEFHGEIYLG